MNGLQLFNFENQEVRTQVINNDPWFVGKDVAEILGYVKPLNAIAAHVDEDDSLKQGVIDSIGREQQTILINESGLYALIFGSKLENAKRFKRWVTSEVLPTIRKTGGYQIVMSQEDIMIATLETQKQLKQEVANVKVDVAELKKEIDLSRYQKAKLSGSVRKNVMDAVGGKKSNAYKELYRTAISEHWREIKNHFGVSSYEEIPKLKFEEAMEVASMWRPSASLAYDIKKLNTQIEMDVSQ